MLQDHGVVNFQNGKENHVGDWVPASNNSVVFPVMMGVLGSALSVLGFIFMKIAHNRFSRGMNRHPICSIHWIIGILLIAVGSVANTISIGTGN